jgi:hypothetical protein
VIAFSDGPDIARWLASKPREIALVIAARATLRVAPLLGFELLNKDSRARMKVARTLVLPAFRGMAAPWLAAAYAGGAPLINFTAAAHAAGRAVLHIHSTDLARRAVFNANATAAAAYPADFVASTAAYAAQAAHLASTIEDEATLFEPISRDANDLVRSDSTLSPSDLALQALWQGQMPSWVSGNWTRMKETLLSQSDDWRVWTDWYEARLSGGPIDRELELARVMIPGTIWNRGPRKVNAEIARLMRKPPPPPKPGPPSIPPQKRAAIEPLWRSGRLTIPKSSAKVNLSNKAFTSALSALQAGLRGLADNIATEANLDKRPVDFLRQLAQTIPDKPPSQEALFLLAHNEVVFARFAKTVDDEWPNILAARYHALALQFDRTMRQSPLWQQFKKNAPGVVLSRDQSAAVAPLAREAARALREDEARDFVDPAIPESLQQLANIAPIEGSDGRETGDEALAVDLLESVNNTLKPIAEAALSEASSTIGAATAAYADEYKKGVIAEAKKAGHGDGVRTIRWLRRLATSGAIAGAAAAGGVTTNTFAELTSLMAKFPYAFEWLTHVLKFIG